MARLILHVGMPKTGTSSLQETFRRGRQDLLREGILYPSSPDDRFRHHQLLLPLVQPSSLPRQFAAIRDDAEEARAAGEAFWADVSRQVDENAPHTVILSYEGLIGAKLPAVERMRALTADRFDRVNVVAYVRHPSTAWVSLMQQSVKASHVVTPPSRFTSKVRAHLTTWLDVFTEDVAARAFDRAALVDGCIVGDFLATFLGEAESLTATLAVRTENESMTAEAMCILQQLRAEVWPTERNIFYPECDEVRAVLTSLRDDVPSTPPRLRAGIEEVLVRNEQGDLDWLAERFGVAFPSWRPAPLTAVDPEVVESRDLRQLLDVAPADIHRASMLLIAELARRRLAAADEHVRASAIPLTPTPRRWRELAGIRVRSSLRRGRNRWTTG